MTTSLGSMLSIGKSVINFDLIMFVNSQNLKGATAAEIHRLPLIYSLGRAMRGYGKVLVVTHYLSLSADFIRHPKKVFQAAFKGTGESIGENIFVYRPVVTFNLALARYFPLLLKITRMQLKAQLQNVLAGWGFSSTTARAVWLSHPYHIDYMGLVGERVAAYDCLEEFSLVGCTNRHFSIVEVEKKLTRKVDFVLAAGLSHTERLRKVNSRTYDFPAAIDLDKFSKAMDAGITVAEEIESIPKPRIGFCGCLKSYDDFDLLEKIVSMRPEWSFVFVGEIAANAANRFSRLKTFKNVYHTGWRSAKDIPRYIKGFDVGMIVCKVNELTNTFSPYKLYDYIGAGVPVVSTPIRESLRFKGTIEIGAEPAEFVSAIERCLSQDRYEFSEKRRSIMETENWDNRAGFALNLFREQLETGQGKGPTPKQKIVQEYANIVN